MSDDLASLRAMVSDLSAQVSRLKNAPQPQTPTNGQAGGFVQPFWRVVTCNGSTLTFTPGSDWGPQFDVVSITDRVAYRVTTAGGEFECEDGISTYAHRFRISWDADAPYQVTCLLARMADNNVAGGGGDGLVQVVFNGGIEEYTIGDEVFTLDVKKGRNVLQIVREFDLPDSVKFCADLFDGKSARFVDPLR